MSLKDTDVKTPGEKSIAKKFKLSLSKVRKLVDVGAKHEKEHNTDIAKAKQVARDHIGERPDYYKMLKKAETTDKNHMKEEIGTGGIRGLGFVTGDPGVNYVDQYINTNAMSYDDWNGNILSLIRDKHSKYLKNMGFSEYSPNDMHTNTNKVVKEAKLNELGEYDNKGGTMDAVGLTDTTPLGQKLKSFKEQSPCWKGYEAIGMKKKKGKSVPNCVPVKEQGVGIRSYTEKPLLEKKPTPDAMPDATERGIYEGHIGFGTWGKMGDGFQYSRKNTYGKIPKPKPESNEPGTGDTYKGSKQGGTKVNKVKPVKEAMATEVPPSYQPTQTQIQRAAPQQARGVKAGQTKINVRSIAPRTTTSGTGSARLSQGGTSGGYNTMKPTTTDVKRNISNRFNPNFSQQSTGSMKASSVKTGSSFSQGGSQVAQKMAKSSPSQVISKMSDAGRQAASVVSKAAPSAAKAAGAIARVAAGPAATAVGAVMSPTPAGEKKSEFQRQADVAKGVSYKSQGRSISDYEKDVLTPKASEAPKAANPKVDAPTPPSRPDYFTRGQAFSAARKEAGGGEGKFSYDNKDYQTNVSGEPYKTQLKQTSVKEETKMDTKELVNEALDCILEDNLSEMKGNLMLALQEKAIEKLEERKKQIAASYFAE